MIATLPDARRLRRARRGGGVRRGRDRRAARGQGRRARDDRPRAARPRRACAAHLDALGERRLRRLRDRPGAEAAAVTSGRRASRATSRSRRSSSSSAASSPMPPRALEPSGLILADKPAGPSSFQVIAAIRRRTGARTGHAGTLDPFASGLLARPLRRGDPARAVARRPRQALLHRGRPLRAHVDRRSGGRGRRDARAAQPGGARGAACRTARRGRAAGSGRLGGEDRRRARLQAAPPRREGRDAGAAVAGRHARAARVRGRCGEPRPAGRLRDVRAGDRGRARRPLQDAPPHRGRAVLRRRRGRPSGSCPPSRRFPFFRRSRWTPARRRRFGPGATRAAPDTRTLHDGRLVAVGSVVMPV